MRVSGDASVLQQVVADLCRAQMSAAMRGERIELRVFREGNHASLTVIGQRPDPADLSQQQVRRLENALTETGGSFAVRYIDEHVAYVATMPLRPVLDETAAPEASHDDALNGVTVMVLDDQEEARDALEGRARISRRACGACAHRAMKRSPGCARLPTRAMAGRVALRYRARRRAGRL